MLLRCGHLRNRVNRGVRSAAARGSPVHLSQPYENAATTPKPRTPQRRTANATERRQLCLPQRAHAGHWIEVPFIADRPDLEGALTKVKYHFLSRRMLVLIKLVIVAVCFS